MRMRGQLYCGIRRRQKGGAARACSGGGPAGRVARSEVSEHGNQVRGGSRTAGRPAGFHGDEGFSGGSKEEHYKQYCFKVSSTSITVGKYLIKYYLKISNIIRIIVPSKNIPHSKHNTLK